MKHENKHTKNIGRLAYMRDQAQNVFELTKGFTTEPNNEAMKTCLEMAGYVLELTNDIDEK